jgi:hypothetical protein
MTRRTACTILLGLGLLAGAARAADPAVVSVQPAVVDGALVCLLETAGLPGDRIVSTLRSGVDSAVELHVELLREDGDVIAGRDILLVLSFDLWEERYAVRDGAQEWRFRDLAALREHLRAPPALPLGPLALLDAGTPAFLRAGLRLHSIAPRTRGRMEELVTGSDDGRRRRSTEEGQEATVSMSRLIRFFYQGGARDEDLVGVRESRRFRPGELADAPH